MTQDPQNNPGSPPTPYTNVKAAYFGDRLPATFEGRRDQRNYIFSQQARDGNLAVFRKYLKESPATLVTGESFEVVRIKQNPASTKTIGGKEVTFPAHESMPSPEEWGTNGWSYGTAMEALEKLKALTAQSKG